MAFFDEQKGCDLGFLEFSWNSKISTGPNHWFIVGVPVGVCGEETEQKEGCDAMDDAEFIQALEYVNNMGYILLFQGARFEGGLVLLEPRWLFTLMR